MEQNLKQRLVGALVLISLAVIFLPLVFDGQQQRIDTAQYAIPEQPVISLKAVDIEPIDQQARQQLDAVNAVEQQKQQQDEQIAAQQAPDQASTAPEQSAATVTPPATSAKVPTAAAPAGTTTSPAQETVATYIEQEKQADKALQAAPAQQTVDLAEAWVIQVGAFSSQPNAEALRDKLRGAGYAAFVKPLKVTSGTLFKVYVGPEIRRYRVDQQKLELEQKYKVKALILKHIP